MNIFLRLSGLNKLIGIVWLLRTKLSGYWVGKTGEPYIYERQIAVRPNLLGGIKTWHRTRLQPPEYHTTGHPIIFLTVSPFHFYSSGRLLYISETIYIHLYFDVLPPNGWVSKKLETSRQ